MSRILKFSAIALLALVCMVPAASAQGRGFGGGFRGGFGGGFYGPSIGFGFYGPGWFYGPGSFAKIVRAGTRDVSRVPDY